MTIPQYTNIQTGSVPGPPFELPTTLQLPSLDLDRWLLHRDQIRDSDLLIDGLLQDIREPDADKRQYLNEL
jgi:hypothetical protein